MKYAKQHSQRSKRRPAMSAAAAMVETLEQRAMFTVTPDPGSTFATAFNVGDLNGTVALTDQVGAADRVDLYRFTMPRAGTFFGRLRATAGSAEIDLLNETS